MTRTFETAALARLPAETVLECGVCWWVYDPAIGDELGDVPPGTAFTALAEDWRCPSCDTEKAKFILPEGGIAEAGDAATETMEARVGALVAAYRKAEEQMLGLPVHNGALDIDAVGFRAYADGFAGVLVTPWCMNVVVLRDPNAEGGAALGSQRDLTFPSGAYRFTLSYLSGVGLVESCSLFSPMDDFTSHEDAMEAALAAAEALFEEPEPEVAAAPERAEEPSRRVLFTFGGASA